MDNIIIECIGYIAALITNSAYIPQILRMYNTKSVKDVDFNFSLLIVTGLILWLIYGMLKGSPSLVFANSIGVLITSTMLVLKIIYGRRND